MGPTTGSLCFLVLFAAGLTGAVELASAQEPKPFAELLGSRESNERLKAVFSMMDGNHDGRVDGSEYRVHIIAAHNQLDRNRDDQLSRDELPAVGNRAFAAADRDANGRLSAFEFHQAPFVQFQALDGNSDGAVTFQELLAYRKSLK